MDKRIRQELIDRLVDLDENNALEIVQRLLGEHVDPLAIIKGCEEAMVFIGENYEKREYHLSGLLMAGEILRETMVLVKPLLEQQSADDSEGKILLGTVQGDIHNIGKDIAAVLLRSNGFAVEDLGVDVPPEVFMEHIKENPPDIVGLSGLITLAYEGMKNTTELVHQYNEERGLHIPVVIGGSTLNDHVCQYVGADYWTCDAVEGVNICLRIMKKKRL